MVPFGRLTDQPRTRAVVAQLVPWLIAVAAFAVYTAISVGQYLTHDVGGYDLAIFTEAVKAYAHGQAPVVPIKGPGFHLLGDHWHPVLVLLAPVYRVWPSPVTLLVVQALLTAVSILPVYRAVAARLGAGSARVVAVCYAASWGVASMVAYDFHEIAFAMPLLAFSLSALARGQVVPAVLGAAPLVTVKEDQGFTLVALGVVIAIAYRRWLLGALVAAWGAGWSLLAILVLIPAFNPDGVYPYWGDGGGLAGLLEGDATKIPMLVLVVLPTAFVALRSPLVLVAVPCLALRLLSTNEYHWGTWFHYSATVMPIVFVAAVDGLARLRGRRHLGGWLRRHAVAMMLAAAAALAFTSPLQDLWDPATYRVDRHDRALDAAVKEVPAGASVDASRSVLPHLAARADATFWGDDAPEWIVFDPDSPEWDVSSQFIRERHAEVTYLTVFYRDGVEVMRRSDQ